MPSPALERSHRKDKGPRLDMEDAARPESRPSPSGHVSTVPTAGHSEEQPPSVDLSVIREALLRQQKAPKERDKKSKKKKDKEKKTKSKTKKGEALCSIPIWDRCALMSAHTQPFGTGHKEHKRSSKKQERRGPRDEEESDDTASASD